MFPDTTRATTAAPLLIFAANSGASFGAQRLAGALPAGNIHDVFNVAIVIAGQACAAEKSLEKFPHWSLQIVCNFVHFRDQPPKWARYGQLLSVVSPPLGCGSVLRRTLLGEVLARRVPSTARPMQVR